MSDNFNTTNIFTDSNITIKEEPIGLDVNIMNTSASVPIPTKRSMDTTNYQEFLLDLDNSQSPLYQDIGIITAIPATDSLENTDLWGRPDDMLKSEALIHMDDDDIFQVDKADLIQGPTLAELNANDETLLGDLNFDDLQLPEEIYMTLPPKLSTPMVNIANLNSHSNNNSPVMVASSCPPSGMMFYRDIDLNSSSVTNNSFDGYGNSKAAAFSPTSQTSSNSSLVQTSPLHVSSLQQKYSTLQDLLLKRDTYESPERSVFGQSVPGANSNCSPEIRTTRTHQSRLSTSAPTHLGLDQIWQRREPRKHLLSTGSLAEAGSTSSLSTGGVLSPDPQDFSHDEFESDEDSDAHYEDYSSENGGDSDDDDEHKQGGSKKERFFWQYNVQAKGPKGERLVMKCKMEDPHVLNEITDPVFSADCSVKGIKHSGKARKGDGNDLTPNARKLFNIGKELDKLSHIINDMTPVSELPFNVRPTSRKEKNKLASRACRLKKKAQHEANKIKLNGLETEHRRLLNGIAQIKQILAMKLNEPSQEKREEYNLHIDKIAKSSTKIKVAGHTTEYVNKVLDKLNSGAAVGLDDL